MKRRNVTDMYKANIYSSDWVGSFSVQEAKLNISCVGFTHHDCGNRMICHPLDHLNSLNQKYSNLLKKSLLQISS